MADQITVRLSPALRRSLRRASRRSRRKDSEIVRLALEAFLSGEVAAASPASRVRRLLGSVDSGLPDLAERHRDYLLEAVKRGR